MARVDGFHSIPHHAESIDPSSSHPLRPFYIRGKNGHTVVKTCIFEEFVRMPYDLPLSGNFKPWKVKIFDNELLCEEPHATIIFKMTRWRYSLRRRIFLDAQPNPKGVPEGILAEIEGNLARLCSEWDLRFPTNPVAQSEEDL